MKKSSAQEGREGIKTIASCIAQIDLDVLQNNQAFNAQDLSLLVNGFSKCFEDEVMQSACRRIAKVITKQWSLRAFNTQNLCLLVNGISKWPEDTAMQALGQKIAIEIIENRSFKEFNAQNLCLLVNGLAKNTKAPAMQTVCRKIAKEIIHKKSFSAFNTQNLCLFVNGFSKWPEDSVMQSACQKIATEITENKLLIQFDPQDISNLVNGLSKWPAGPVMQSACQKIATEIIENRLLAQFGPQCLSNLVNGLSKWPADPVMQSACQKIATEIIENRLLDQFGPQCLSNLVNGFSKWSADPAMQSACQKIATEISRKNVLKEFSAQNLVHLVNGFSKWPADPAMQSACQKIATEITKNRSLKEFNMQSLAILMHGLSKNIKDPAMQSACRKIATEIIDNRSLTQFGPQGLACLANGCSKDMKHLTMQVICQKIAKVVITKRSLAKFSEKILLLLVDGLGQCIDDATMQAICTKIAREIIENRLPTQFNIHQLSGLLNSFSRWLNYDTMQTVCAKIAYAINHQSLMVTDSHTFSELVDNFSKLLPHNNGVYSSCEEEDAYNNLFLAVLDSLAQQAKSNPYLIQEAGIISVGRLLKASCRLTNLGNDQLIAYPDVIIPALVTRITRLLEAKASLQKVGLETLGTLCMGLYGIDKLSYNQRKNDACTRQGARNILYQLFPFVKKKSDLFIGLSKEKQLKNIDKECYDTRCPTLTYYRILKAYSALVRIEKQTKQEKEILEWLSTIFNDHVDAILDYAPYTFNFVAKLHAELNKETSDSRENLEPSNIRLDNFLKLFLQKYSAKLAFSESPSLPERNGKQQNLLAILGHELDHPAKGSGVLKLIQTDIYGEAIQGRTRTIDYCILGRLFNSKERVMAPFLEVMLPARNLNAFHLNRFICYNHHNRPFAYRLDLFGGNRMQGSTQTPKDLIRQKVADDHGSLLAIPLNELDCKRPFGGFISKLFPNKESFFYFQRALLAAPMEQPGKTVENSVLEGKFTVKVYRHYNDNVPHPFNIKSLNLRPHDGCGFIRQTVAHKMGIALKQKKRTFNKPSYLPAQALKHYTLQPENETIHALKEEIKAKLTKALESFGPLYDVDAMQALSEDEKHNLCSAMFNHLSSTYGVQLFRLLTSGGIEGKNLIALPSSDHRVYGHNLSKKLLIGRAPYDQPNLCPITREDKKENATDRFLKDKVQAIQYSLVAQDASLSLASSPSDVSIWFAKGLLVVIPDDWWPLAHVDIVLSSDDIKTHSTWTSAQKKEAFQSENQDLSVHGMLVAVDAYGPGECIALPIDKQTYLNGDFDGDKVLVIRGDDYENLHQFVEVFFNDAKNLFHRKKPKKTFTSAYDKDNAYCFGRGEEILATKKVY